MSCEVSEPMIWKSLCEDWKVPEYCSRNFDDSLIAFNLSKSMVTVDDKCLSIRMLKPEYQGKNKTKIHIHDCGQSGL